MRSEEHRSSSNLNLSGSCPAGLTQGTVRSEEHGSSWTIGTVGSEEHGSSSEHKRQFEWSVGSGSGSGSGVRSSWTQLEEQWGVRSTGPAGLEKQWGARNSEEWGARGPAWEYKRHTVCYRHVDVQASSHTNAQFCMSGIAETNKSAQVELHDHTNLRKQSWRENLNHNVYGLVSSLTYWIQFHIWIILCSSAGRVRIYRYTAEQTGWDQDSVIVEPLLLVKIAYKIVLYNDIHEIRPLKSHNPTVWHTISWPTPLFTQPAQ